jgi:hypothetical protein
VAANGWTVVFAQPANARAASGIGNALDIKPRSGPPNP